MRRKNRRRKRRSERALGCTSHIARRDGAAVLGPSARSSVYCAPEALQGAHELEMPMYRLKGRLAL